MSDDLKNVIVFTLGGARSATELRWVREVISLGFVTSVPTAPPGIAGAFNLRGHLVPVLDIAALARAGHGASPRQGDSALLVEIDGSLAGPADGLKLCGSATVQGLAIHSFSGAGIRVGCGSAQVSAPVVITGNYIGTDASGLVARGNGSGIVADVRNALGSGFSSSLEIGGFSPSFRNLIAASRDPSVGSGADATLDPAGFEALIHPEDRPRVEAARTAKK